MKIYIFVDIEGISGVSNRKYISMDEGRPDLVALARKYMAEDTNACIEGCFRGGAFEVIVRDGHGGSSNMTREQIDPRADFIDGMTPGIRFADMDGADGLILLGYHAMAGTAGAILEHTYSSVEIQNVWLNGRKAGEVGIDAAIAAEHQVPVILVSGDDKVCAEAEDWIPGVVTCEVKKGFSSFGARMPSLEKTRQLITRKAEEAVRKVKQIPCIRLEYPVKYRVELVERRQPNPWAERIDGRTYEVETNSVEQTLLGKV